MHLFIVKQKNMVNGRRNNILTILLSDFNYFKTQSKLSCYSDPRIQNFSQAICLDQDSWIPRGPSHIMTGGGGGGSE